VPFLSLTPVFLLVVPTLLLGERLTPAGGLGIILIAIGGYALHLRKLRQGFFAPLKSILHEPGSLCMIGVALLYSFTSTLGKQAITAASPLVFAAFYFPLLAILMTPLVLWQARSEFCWQRLQGSCRVTFLPGLLYALMLVSHMYAINMVNVAYMISVKRLSLVIGVVYGHLLFGEEGLAERMFGASLMVTGVALILIAGGS
jgi:drug/metabolite transporter (DMT)-like permease